MCMTLQDNVRSTEGSAAGSDVGIFPSYSARHSVLKVHPHALWVYSFELTTITSTTPTPLQKPSRSHTRILLTKDHCSNMSTKYAGNPEKAILSLIGLGTLSLLMDHLFVWLLQLLQPLAASCPLVTLV